VIHELKTAAKLLFGPISRPEAVRLCVSKHYLHRPPPLSHAFGIFDAGKAVGVITFGIPASREILTGACPTNPEKVIELNRLWVSDDCPKNTESWFIAKAFRALPPLIVVSYADTAHGHLGTVYRASGFHYAGWTDMDRKTPRFDYVPEDHTESTLFGDVTTKRHSRDAFRVGFVEKVRRLPKHRYWRVSGNRRERFHLEKLCRWPSLAWKAQAA
jgi:hypothetical protein